MAKVEIGLNLSIGFPINGDLIFGITPNFWLSKTLLHWLSSHQQSKLDHPLISSFGAWLMI